MLRPLQRCLLIIAICMCLPAQAEDDSWRFSASPYFWAAGASGDVGQSNLPPAEMDSSFDDIWKDLDFAFMATAEMRKNRVSFLTDWVYTKLSSSGKTPRGYLIDHVNVSSKTLAALFAAGYTFAHTERGVWDWILGVRAWRAKSELAFKGGVWNGVKGSDDDSWINAVTGVRGRYDFNQHIYMSASALAGAGQADLDWEATALLGIEFTPSLSMVVGYRALGVDYSDGGFVYDVVQKGPIAGVVLHF